MSENYLKKQLVLDIKCNALDDGPGVRAAVFFKGCPLSCVWCHNPESKKIENEITYDKEKCIGCHRCIETCEKDALSRKSVFFVDRNRCTLCFECCETCPSKALAPAAKLMSVDEIFGKIIRDKVFYNISKGGVTLTGGEVTLFPDFAGELLRKCKENGVSTLIETCGHFKYDVFKEKMLAWIDIIYYDLKLFDRDFHIKYCGLDNDRILENLKKLNKESKGGNFDLLVRVPLIPNITDTEQNLKEIANFLEEIGVLKVSLLPYNPTWYPKSFKIGLKTPSSLKNILSWQNREKLAACEHIFIKKNIEIF